MSNKPFVKEEKSFLTGSRSRIKELKYLGGIVMQFFKGFRKLHFIGPCVTVFGSARFKEDHPYYNMAREVSAEISKMGFAIMTGGGPGIMEAANRGAKDAGGLSLGCNILLPHEQHNNPYLDEFVDFESFFVRKELLRKYSFAFVVLPGGYGTLDELFETLTLVQTGKMEKFPIIIMGKEYHQHILAHINKMIEAKTISPEDIDLVLFTDSTEEAVNHIRKFKGLAPTRKLNPPKKTIAILGEEDMAEGQQNRNSLGK